MTGGAGETLAARHLLGGCARRLATLIGLGFAIGVSHGSSIPMGEHWSIGFGGRFMVDALGAGEEALGSGDRFDIRRARLKTRIKYKKDTKLTASVNFPDGEVHLMDFRLDYELGRVWLALGRMQEPFGLSAMSSSKFLPLMERPLASAIGPGYGLGARANIRGRRWALSGGAFSPVTRAMELSRAREEDSLDLRWTYTPFREDWAFIHVGASVSLRQPNGRGARYSLRPESILASDLKFRSVRIADADRIRLEGLEFAWRLRSALLEAEYFRSNIYSPAIGRSRFDGGYVGISWALTGEKRSYSTRRGAFGSIRPNASMGDSGLGALEIAGRYSWVDLSRPIGGASGSVWSLGLNWYPNDHWKAAVNFLQIDRDEPGETVSEHLLQFRLQYHF